MEIVGEYTIPQSQMRTWEAVCDAEIMKACIPGCETLERTSPTEFHLTMTTKITSRATPTSPALSRRYSPQKSLNQCRRFSPIMPCLPP